MPPSPRRQASAPSLYLAVAVGSGLGAVLRHGVAFGVGAPGGAALPLATLSVNIMGSFVIGFFATLTGPGGRAPVGPVGRQFVMAGLCGGLTTFSIFSLETMQLLQTGRIDAATSYVAISLLLWVPSAAAGHLLARRLNEHRRHG